MKMLKVKNVEQAPEILLYFLMESLGSFMHSIYRARHRPSGGEPELFSEGVQRDLDNARSDQEAILEILKQREGLAFADHDEYMKWYRWWSNWHKHELTADQWYTLDRMLTWDGSQTEETFKDWRPEGDWREAETVA